MTVSEVAKTVASNLQGSCLAAVALAAMLAVLTYMSLRAEQTAGEAEKLRRHEAIMQILKLCPLGKSTLEETS